MENQLPLQPSQPTQHSLFGQGPPQFVADFTGAERANIGHGAWVELVSDWLVGHGAVFTRLMETTRWRSEIRQMYERTVAVPRLTAHYPQDGPGHPLLGAMACALSRRYRQDLHDVSAAYYRCGQDSVAPHGDRVGRERRECVVAILSLGEPRVFFLRPVGGGGSHRYMLGFGDLLVMGGTCQRTWTHGVPKVSHAGARISVQFRPRRPLDLEPRKL